MLEANLQAIASRDIHLFRQFDVNGRPVVAAYAIEAPVEITLKVGARQLETTDLMGNRQSLSCPRGIAKLHLTETPLYLLGADRKALIPETE